MRRFKLIIFLKESKERMNVLDQYMSLLAVLQRLQYLNNIVDDPDDVHEDILHEMMQDLWNDLSEEERERIRKKVGWMRD